MFVVEKWIDIVLKYHLDPAARVLPGKINATENCAHCNWGLTTLPGEVNVRVIVLLQGRFEFSEGPTLKASLLSWIVLYKDNQVMIYHIWLL